MSSSILLTGISKGLGLVTAHVLLARGYRIYGISRSITDELKHLMEKYPQKLEWLKFDLEDWKNIKIEIFKNWIGYKTPIQGMVNNAALVYEDLVSSLNTASLEKLFHVNVFSGMVLTQCCIRQMLLHQIQGSIVHISSISAHTGYRGLSFYASTKGAIEAFSKNVSREWGERKIRSNCVVGGFMDTPMSSSLSEKQRNQIFRRTAIKGPVDQKSIAETIAFLLSESANSITGQNIYVDNGSI